MASIEVPQLKNSHSSPIQRRFCPMLDGPCPYNSNNSNNTKATEDCSPLAAHKSSTSPAMSESCSTKDTSSNPPEKQQSLEGKLSITQKWRLKVSSENRSNIVRSHVISAPSTLRKSSVRSVSSASEKGSDVKEWSQRPLAKRQLSGDSPACHLRVVKRNTGHRDKGEGRVPEKTGPNLMLRQRDAYHSGGNASQVTNGVAARRSVKKELYASEETFFKVDQHAISTGRELREDKVFSIQTITQRLSEGAQTELETLRAIWTWMCHYIEYDVSGYLGLTDKLCGPEEVIEVGRGVCSGYSSVCLQMCKTAGIQCKEVSGHGKGIGYKQGQSYQNTKSCHMWNAVCLGGHWYLLDACWGAGRVDLDNKVFIKRYDDFYFLTDPVEFINSHCPDELEWQLLEKPVPLDEFEKRVLKTSEFYRLGLTLLYPKYFLFVTVNGEASVSMRFSEPVDFTYQISHSNNNQPAGGGCSFGLLTTTQNTMRLQLLPPRKGTYDIMIFARPGNMSGPFSWICSFVLECLNPRPNEELPENPFLSWGLQRNAESLGVKTSNHGSEALPFKNGSFDLVLHTARPLMMLCELTHKDLNPSIAKRCLATQIQAELLTCHVLCPYLGYYRLSVFVRDYETPQDSYQNVGNFLLHCTEGAVNLNDLFPSSLRAACGSGIRTQDAGLSKFSHTGAIVSTQKGKCNITFQNQQDLEVHALLCKDQRKMLGYPLSRHVLLTYNCSKVTVSVALPEAGMYKLSLYTKSPAEKDFSAVCDFVLKNTSRIALPPFPCIYTAWQKGSVLLEPRQGLLEPMSWVQFRVRIPQAQRVSILGEQLVDLQLNKSRVWEGKVFTGAVAKQLKLAASRAESSSELSIIMCFDVLRQQSEI